MLYRRRDIKRMFAYSSIEHMGIIVFAFGMGGPLANFAGLLHMTMHSLTKSAIFFAVGHIAQVKGTQKIADMGGLTVTHPVLGWGLVLGVVAIAGLPPLGIFMSEFLVVSSTFAREPWLAVVLVLAILVALGGLFLRLNTHCLRRAARAGGAGAGLLRADVRASRARVHGRHLYAAGAGRRLRERRAAVGIAPWLLDQLSHRQRARGHRPWPRVTSATTAGAPASTCSWRAVHAARPVGRRRRGAHGAARRGRRRDRRAHLRLRGRQLPERRRPASAGAAAGARHPRSVRPGGGGLARHAALARSRLLGRRASARQARAGARARALSRSCRSKAKGCIRSRSGRCMPASSSRAISASPPTASTWCGWKQRLGYVHKGIESLMAGRDARARGASSPAAPPATAPSLIPMPSRWPPKPPCR